MGISVETLALAKKYAGGGGGGSDIKIDATLTKAGFAADAKVVGDAFNSVPQFVFDGVASAINALGSNVLAPGYYVENNDYDPGTVVWHEIDGNIDDAMLLYFPEGHVAGESLDDTPYVPLIIAYELIDIRNNLSELEAEMDASTVTVTGTEPVITAEANTCYICGEVSSITITPPSSGICDVTFTSGTTAAVLSVPNTVKFPTWFDATSLETNTIYEINISDGRAVVMTWAL